MSAYPTNNWAELKAAQEGDAILEELAWRQAKNESFRFPCSTEDMVRAHNDALRASVKGIPHPQDVAQHLLEMNMEAAERLAGAYFGQRDPYKGILRVSGVNDDPEVVALRYVGLVGWTGKDDGCAVTQFGSRVRAVVISMIGGQAEGDG